MTRSPSTRHLGLAVRLEAHEEDAQLPGPPVVLLAEAVGAHVPVEDEDLGARVGLLEADGVLHRRGAAHAAAVLVAGLARAHALDEHHPLGLAALGDSFAGGHQLFQLQQGLHPPALPVAVLRRAALRAPGGDDGHPVLDLHVSPPAAPAGPTSTVELKLPTKPSTLARRAEVKARIFGWACEPGDEPADEGPHVLPAGVPPEAQGVAAQPAGLLHQVHLEALVGQVQGGGHPGHAPADHQGPRGDRQRDGLAAAR